MNSTTSTFGSTLPTQPQYAKTSLNPLTEVVRQGMIAMGIAGLLSAVSTLGLLFFITYRMIYWRRYYEQPMIKNQVLVLIYNLLLADFQQSIAFVISFYWLSQNKMVGPSPWCTAQGWFIQIGDTSSGLWVFSIGVHTFVSLVSRKIVPQRVFLAWVCGVWAFCFGISAAGPIKIKDIFIPTAAWCWIDSAYRWERLYLHYAYIFLAQLGSIIIYSFIVLFLYSRITPSATNQNTSGPQTSSNDFSTQKKHDPFAASRQRILQTARYMVLYPFAYVTLTSPLAASRVAAMAGEKPPVDVYILAGVMMTSCGWIDVLLYITTRRALISSTITAKKGPNLWHKINDWLGFGKAGGGRSNSE